jgi:hypothetical protein
MIIETIQNFLEIIEIYINSRCPLFFEKSMYHFFYKGFNQGETHWLLSLFYIISFTYGALMSLVAIFMFRFLPRAENRFSIFQLYLSQYRFGYFYLNIFILCMGLLFPILIPCLIAFLIGLFMTTWIYLIWRDRRFMKRYRQRKREEEIRKRDKDARTL